MDGLLALKERHSACAAVNQKNYSIHSDFSRKREQKQINLNSPNKKARLKCLYKAQTHNRTDDYDWRSQRQYQEPGVQQCPTGSLYNEVTSRILSKVLGPK